MADEGIYVLDGELGVRIEDEYHVATAGMFVLLPHGVPHALSRVSTPPRVVPISAPGGWECYLEDLFEAGSAVLTDSELDPAKINPIAAAHGITYH